MTVRTAELVTAIVLALLSVGLMFKSAELNIGWVKGSGPGAGAWPFWLSVGMLLSSLAIIWRWIRGVTPESRSEEVFLSTHSQKVVVPALLGLLGLLAGTQIIGIYFSIMLFMFYFVRILGRHSWPTSIGLMIGTPVAMFMFFEWALKITLPQGLSEPLFYPIYDLMY
jgi:putative tricarboxylic transport membrane protein